MRSTAAGSYFLDMTFDEESGQVVYDGYGSEMVGLYVVGGGTASGVGTIKANDMKGVGTVYSLSGVRRAAPATGLNIVRNADGTARKIVRR